MLRNKWGSINRTIFVGSLGAPKTKVVTNVISQILLLVGEYKKLPFINERIFIYQGREGSFSDDSLLIFKIISCLMI